MRIGSHVLARAVTQALAKALAMVLARALANALPKPWPQWSLKAILGPIGPEKARLKEGTNP